MSIKVRSAVQRRGYPHRLNDIIDVCNSVSELFRQGGSTGKLCPTLHVAKSAVGGHVQT